ncbi:MAG: alanine--tRNA ligase, partial [Bacteroidota bacterium]
MTAQEVRQQFFDFFRSKGHEIVPSAPLVIKNDPTLMFTNAGMNQFKDYFLGNQTPKNRRVADTQKCLRVSGKHNDLEEVGIDTYHHTLFEMLGNWSFGDYFKEESIAWAWELLTDVYKLPKDRLYVTVFGGDEADKLKADEEAVKFWEKHIDKDRILYFDRKDNFWEMGDTGPCGPCSEIHIDLRADEDRKKADGKDLVNQDHEQVIEIWNLVFIQFNRMADGSLKVLPEKHVDTGMGFERLVRAIHAQKSNYDSDVFTPLLDFIAKESGKPYGKNEKDDIAMRVMSDHVRAVAFAIADGEIPSNNKAGYVIKRILRRAVRYGYTFLGIEEPFLYRLVDILAEQFKEVFPEIPAQKEQIQRVIQHEEKAFLQTLEKGLKLFEEVRENLGDKDTMDGETVFRLNDTFGFPKDLTALIAREQGLKIDEKGYQKALEAQKNRSRSAATSNKGDWIELLPDAEVSFVGYDELTAQTCIIKYREVKEKKKTFYQIVLEKTPFYGESGGQVGDRGYLETAGEKVSIRDTKKENELIILIADKLPTNPKAEFTAVVDARKRAFTENNHSATHLMHSALREVLGDHVAQKGSLVNEKGLRFDFSHFQKVEPEQLREVERMVNEKIRENIAKIEERSVPIEEAKARGAMALFGEKYGDSVRVITFDPKYSVELCGGTHVPATGHIGLFKITSESAVGAGIRRIEAVTAEGAEKLVLDKESLIQDLGELVGEGADLRKSVQKLVEEKEKLAKKLEALENQATQATKNDLLKKVEDKNGINFLAAQVSLPSAQAVKQIAYEMREQVENLFLVLAAEVEGKPQIAIMIADNVVSDELNA